VNEPVDAFLEVFRPRCKVAGFAVTRWPKSRHPSKSIIEFSPPVGRAIAYLKVRNAVHGFWGLNPNQLRAMEKSGQPWCVVLLHGTDLSGFILPSDVVNHATQDLWRPGHDSEFKVNENRVIPFTANKSFDDLAGSIIEFVKKEVAPLFCTA